MVRSEGCVCFGGGRGGVGGDVEGCPPHANNKFLIFIVISEFLIFFLSYHNIVEDIERVP